MKFEVYPNRDSTVFMDRFSMGDAETFIRGTIRFKGFSAIISAFHDVGLTSDDPVPEQVNTLRQLCQWRFSLSKENNVSSDVRQLIDNLAKGCSSDDAQIVKGVLSRVDTAYLGGSK